MGSIQHSEDTEFNDIFNQEVFFFFPPNRKTVFNRSQRKPSKYIENSISQPRSSYKTLPKVKTNSDRLFNPLQEAHLSCHHEKWSG